jgi:hypothetical protein
MAYGPVKFFWESDNDFPISLHHLFASSLHLSNETSCS